MTSLSNIYITKETLETILITLEKKKETGVSLTIELRDVPKVFTTKTGNEITQDVAAWVEQSKEDREAKKKRFYVGSGKTFWRGK